jgi:hypothetical protein
VTSERVLAALEIIDRGLFVVPLADRSKRPRGGMNWRADASDSPDVARDWWSRWPDANVGVVAARSPELVILDIDPRNGGARSALGELPATFTVETGRGDGGVHLYFRLLLRTVTAIRHGGVDDKSNGYVVGPGSVHPDTGNHYRVIDEAPIAPLPEHLSRRVEVQKRRRVGSLEPVLNPRMHADSALSLETDQVRSAPAGTRNDTLYRGAFRMATFAARGALDIHEVVRSLGQAATASGLTRREAAATISSAINAGLTSEQRRDW